MCTQLFTKIIYKSLKRYVAEENCLGISFIIHQLSCVLLMIGYLLFMTFVRIYIKIFYKEALSVKVE